MLHLSYCKFQCDSKFTLIFHRLSWNILIFPSRRLLGFSHKAVMYVVCVLSDIFPMTVRYASSQTSLPDPCLGQHSYQKPKAFLLRLLLFTHLVSMLGTEVSFPLFRYHFLTTVRFRFFVEGNFSTLHHIGAAAAINV